MDENDFECEGSDLDNWETEQVFQDNEGYEPEDSDDFDDTDELEED